MGKSFDSSWIMPSFRGVLSVRLVIVRTIIIIVPLVVSFLLHALLLLASIFDPAMRICAVDDVAQVAVIPITPSAVLLWWSEATG
jgi:hypothetical protein